MSRTDLPSDDRRAEPLEAASTGGLNRTGGGEAATQREVVIRCEGVTAGFDDRVLFKDVSFDVKRGEVFVILGGSGCGKSTLLKLMIGLIPPRAGRVSILGTDVWSTDGADRLALLRRIGVMWQQGALFGSQTLLENVEMPLAEHTALRPDARRSVARVKLGLVGLSEAADRLPAEISGGMLKRAGVARALALDPPILFLDEPSAGLDPITSAGLDAMIKDLAASLGTTFVVVTHELASILAIGDRCIMLDKQAQGVIASGDPRKLRDDSTNPTVRAFFRREAA